MNTPYIKCDETTWDYLKPILYGLGYNVQSVNNKNWDDYPYLVLDYGNTEKHCGNIFKEQLKNRYEIFVVEDFIKYIYNSNKNLINNFFQSLNCISFYNYPIINIFKNLPSNYPIYSLLDSYMKFIKIEDDMIICEDNNNNIIKFNEYGSLGDSKFRLIYPSEYNFCWENFQFYKIGTKVMCSNDGNDWRFRIYYSGHKTYNELNSSSNYDSWKYIIPFDDFNINDNNENIKNSIV